MQASSSSQVLSLPAGGFVVQTSEGWVQFGIPPETIKDTMTMPCGVPSLYIVPRKMFYLDRGISTAEMEFPFYYNFFILRRKCRILCTASQKRRLTAVMKESVFGPEELDLTLEYMNGRKNFRFPDLRAEVEFFRKNPFRGGKRLELADMVQFTTFDADGSAKVGAVRVAQHKGGFTVFEGDSELARFPENMTLPPRKSEATERRIPFQPPVFGVTAIGAGHGFLPGSKTSGFIVWINRRGIMIDPPVDSTEWLREREINPKIIDTIILTHCHADHDSGTMQKILEEGRCTLVTTATILHSFLRKAAALTGLK
ncbi:MAG: MBL fold metallo-hydrolase, partial [Candidatus Wallbacteria bacterium]|nr:MBL fold metallo-hydrolase [Candidatus Wallbacteria bacterium]